MASCRVFISYARQDINIVRELVKVLREIGVTPVWDQDFSYGCGFQEQIRSFIAHAHVFLPVMTPESSSRGWVHQEIGYAMALNIPVLPVVCGVLPGEMIQLLQAIQVDQDPEKARKEFAKRMTRDVIDNLVLRFQDTQSALYECAEQAEDRAEKMARYCTSLSEIGQRGFVRQKGGVSFYVPSKVVNHPIWKTRYSPQERSPYHCRLLQSERVAIEKHAADAGCRLIVNPHVPYRKYDEIARRTRLQILLEFLGNEAGQKTSVAIDKGLVAAESLTIVGDWFMSESVSAVGSQGYRQTIFTRHAPSMGIRAELFDQEFGELLHAAGWTEEASRTKAMEVLSEVIEGSTKEAVGATG